MENTIPTLPRHPEPCARTNESSLPGVPICTPEQVNYIPTHPRHPEPCARTNESSRSGVPICTPEQASCSVSFFHDTPETAHPVLSTQDMEASTLHSRCINTPNIAYPRFLSTHDMEAPLLHYPVSVYTRHGSVCTPTHQYAQRCVPRFLSTHDMEAPCCTTLILPTHGMEASLLHSRQTKRTRLSYWQLDTCTQHASSHQLSTQAKICYHPRIKRNASTAVPSHNTSSLVDRTHHNNQNQKRMRLPHAPA